MNVGDTVEAEACEAMAKVLFKLAIELVDKGQIPEAWRALAMAGYERRRAVEARAAMQLGGRS